MSIHRHKSNLPEKMCPVCLRPFSWRKKWERDWEHVKYCSERCRRAPNPKPNDANPANPREPR